MPENASSMVTLNLSNKNFSSFNDLKKYKNLVMLDKFCLFSKLKINKKNIR